MVPLGGTDRQPTIALFHWYKYAPLQIGKINMCNFASRPDRNMILYVYHMIFCFFSATLFWSNSYISLFSLQRFFGPIRTRWFLFFLCNTFLVHPTPRIKLSVRSFVRFSYFLHASHIHASYLHASYVPASCMHALCEHASCKNAGIHHALHTCIMHTCIMHACIMHTCIMQTCIMCKYIMHTYTYIHA